MTARTLATLLGLGSAFIVNTGPGHAAGQNAGPTGDEVRAILADRIDRARQSVAIVVALVGADGTRFISYGRTRKDGGDAVGPDTIFEIGSVTKVFTTTVLADMAVKGQVALDDPIGRYLPDTVRPPTRGGRSITLEDLATQTSGLPRLPSNLAPKDVANPYADYTAGKLDAFLSSYTLTRDPGAQYQYSNLGGGLLGHLLARRTGSGYATLVRERITAPLRMTSTAVILTAEERQRLAQGHTAALAPAANWDFDVLAGAGALRSTARDLATFVAANLGLVDTPLASAMRLARQPRHDTGTPNLAIGLGWHILTATGSTLVWHNGGTGGYHAFVGFDPDRRVGVAVLSNAANDIDDIGRHLVDSRYPLATPSPPATHTAITLDPAVFDQYVGAYQLTPQFVITVSREGDRFFVQATGQPKLEIAAESSTEFFLVQVDAQITFVSNAAGRVTGLVLHQNGQDQPATKIRWSRILEFLNP